MHYCTHKINTEYAVVVKIKKRIVEAHNDNRNQKKKNGPQNKVLSHRQLYAPYTDHPNPMAASGSSLIPVRPAAIKTLDKILLVSQGKEPLSGPPIKYQYIPPTYVSQKSKKQNKKSTLYTYIIVCSCSIGSTGTIFSDPPRTSL